MCGIAGLVSAQGKVDQAMLERMSDALHHRGPDDSSSWYADNVGLAHRRLSILDLSRAGLQPMTSHNDEWVLTFNGEIYNFEQLRAELDGPWTGHSDTEVLVNAIATWGVEQTTRRLIGMFAFAAYHKPSKTMFLVRDRLGIKPLYYGWVGQQFVFASELHALKPLTALTLNHNAIASYLRHSFIPAPGSIFNEIHKAKPGVITRLDCQAGPEADMLHINYWSASDHALRAASTEPHEQLLDELHNTLRQAVSDRLVADVPLGAFLSGGFDSSLVCALMQEQATARIKTYTIGFDEHNFNEAAHAKSVAQHLGTDHTELYLSEQDLLDTIPQLPQMMDEPFADASLIPTHLVCKLARQHVTVALSGDGGDELFWGYQRYATTQRIWSKLRFIPQPMALTMARILKASWLNQMTSGLAAPAWGGRSGRLNQKLTAASELLEARDQQRFYESMMSHWKDPTAILNQGRDLLTAYNDPQHFSAQLAAMPRMAWQDTVAYLPDDILTKVDRASMAVGLEARVPLLDHRVVELAASLPAQMKLSGGVSKYALRKILARYVPPALTDRPKMGFGVPLDKWLRGPLHDWAADLLNPTVLNEQGIMRPQPIELLWRDHQAGRANNSAKLWDVLMLQSWLTTWRSP